MGRPSKLNSVDKEHICQAREQKTASAMELAELYKVHLITIYKVWREAGLTKKKETNAN
jgi:hypothetical protein